MAGHSPAAGEPRGCMGWLRAATRAAGSATHYPSGRKKMDSRENKMTPNLRAATLALAFWAACAVQLAHAAPPPAEAFYKDADVADAVLSPSGRRLAMTAAKGTPRAGLVVFDLAPGGRIV